jgi:hypothetical protein
MNPKRISLNGPIGLRYKHFKFRIENVDRLPVVYELEYEHISRQNLLLKHSLINRGAVERNML